MSSSACGAGRSGRPQGLYARNDLLRTRSYAGIIGVKTGHTDAAGWSQVAAARRQGQTMYAIVLGSPGRARRNADLSKLLDWGFGHFGRVTLVRANGMYATAAVPYSDDRIPLVAPQTVQKVVRLGRPLVERVVAPSVVDLPVSAGDPIGEVVVLDGSVWSCGVRSSRDKGQMMRISSRRSAGTLAAPSTRPGTCWVRRPGAFG